ncbi:MAG: hypothetical protein IJ903_00310 [Ruminococcus sp.]|nr:hypothetical protein [Ruminococcus sp.]
MRMTKKITSIVLAVLMVVSMMSVMAISASAAGEVAEIVTVGEGGTGAVGDQFTSVNDAVNAAGEGGEVKLIADIYSTGNEGYVGIDGTYTTTLDLNGHNITANGTSGITLYSKYPGGKTFTIKGSGTVTCTPKYAGDACISDSSGRKVVIKGGTYTNTVEGKNALYVSSDQGWTIEKGTFNGNIKVISDLTVKGGTINGNINATGPSWTVDPASVTITGGTVNGELVSENGSTFEVKGGTFTDDVSAYVDLESVMVEYTNTKGKTQYYTSNPLGACSSGTYKLLKDITSTTYITTGIFGYDVTVDLNGHTYTSSSTRGYAVLASRNGDYKMTIKNGTINYTNASSDYAAVQYQGKGNELTLEGVTINSAVAGVAMLGEDEKLTIKDSTINATDDFALATNGSKTKNGTITVEDSTLTSNGSVGVYLPGDADATFDNATVSGTTAMYIKGGDVDIIGGSYTGTGDHADYSYNGSGCNPTGDAIVVENAGSAYPANNVTISDDAALAVTGNGTYALGAYTKEAEDAVEVALDNVTVPSAYGVGEATFTFANGADITSAGTPEGWELVDNGNGTATVVYAPLNPLEKAAADINDGNLFGINCDYLKGTLLGVQKKSVAGEDTSSQEGAKNIRFVAVLDTDLIQDADDYGFVLAKVGTNKTTQNTNFNNLKAYWGNGEKTVSAMDTYNNVCGNEAYGDPNNTSTSYKYVTCAVNNVDDNSKIVARFFYKKDGKTYYAKYAAYNYAYTGCTSSADAT